MEVCDLDVCNFIETRFKECETVEEWKLIGKKKGVVVSNIPIEFTDEYITPEYEFVIYEENTPLDVFIEQWDSKTMVVKWWYMMEFSCVVVPRNRGWFASVLPKLADAWKTILEERESGEYKKRLPKKKTPKSKCLLSDLLLENERIAGANNSQPVNKGWGRILLFGSAQPTQKYEAKGGFTGGYAPNGGNLGFPTDDRIFRNGMTENETYTIHPMSNPFCKYKYLFGIPYEGLRQYRILGLSIYDLVVTAIGTFFVSWFLKIPFWKCFIAIFVLGEIIHYVFCIDTQFILYMKELFKT